MAYKSKSHGADCEQGGAAEPKYQQIVCPRVERRWRAISAARRAFKLRGRAASRAVEWETRDNAGLACVLRMPLQKEVVPRIVPDIELCPSDVRFRQLCRRELRVPR